MKKSAIWLAVASTMLAALPAGAGVIVTQQSVHPDGKGGTTTVTRTTMIEGNKEKVVDENHTSIVDLDKGTMVTLDEARKTATEMSLDPKGHGGLLLQGMLSSMAGNFQSTGAHKTVAGYGCEEYTSSGTMMMVGEYSATTCFSKEAPGASEYGKFYKRMMEKLGANPASGSFPEGIMLSQEMTMKSAVPAMPGMSPEVAQKLAEAKAKQGPQVSHTEVTNIKLQSISADTFAVPTGYKTQTVDFGAMMGGGKPPAGKPAPHD